MKCPTCGKPYIPPRKLQDAAALVKSGVRPAAAARACGVSRQRLHQHMKLAK